MSAAEKGQFAGNSLGKYRRDAKEWISESASGCDSVQSATQIQAAFASEIAPMRFWLFIFFVLMIVPAQAADVTVNYQTSTGPQQVSSSFPLPVTTTTSSGGVSTLATSVLASNLVVDAAPGNLYSFNVSADSTLSGAAWWIMIFNATSLPGDGTVTPAKCYAVPTGTTSYSAAFNAPVAFSTGIVIGVSATGCFTKTASTHAFISGDYK